MKTLNLNFFVCARKCISGKILSASLYIWEKCPLWHLAHFTRALYLISYRRSVGSFNQNIHKPPCLNLKTTKQNKALKQQELSHICRGLDLIQHNVLNHSSPLAQPAIQSLPLNLRWFGFLAWTPYTYTQKVVMLLWTISLKLDQKHEKVWALDHSHMYTIHLFNSTPLSASPTTEIPVPVSCRNYPAHSSPGRYTLPGMPDWIWRIHHASLWHM